MEITAVPSLTLNLFSLKKEKKANAPTFSKPLQVSLKIADPTQRNHLPESN